MKRNRLWIVVAAAAGLVAADAWGSPKLSLVQAGGSGTAATLAAGSQTLQLGMRLDSDGAPISGLQYHLATPGDARYGTPAVTATLNPFSAADLVLQPATGAPLSPLHPTVWFTLNADYAPVRDAEFATCVIDISRLPLGVHTFLPVGEELTNGSGTTITSFAAGGAFALTVVPEPAAAGLLAFAYPLLRRRRQLGSPAESGGQNAPKAGRSTGCK